MCVSEREREICHENHMKRISLNNFLTSREKAFTIKKMKLSTFINI